MKKTKTKHVIFYNLSEVHSHPTGQTYPHSIKEIIEYIKNHTKLNRKYSLNTEKFCLVESAMFNKTTDSFEILLKSARHGFRPPLINIKTTNERENPKTIEEGEIEKVHLILKLAKESVIICMEKNKSGASIGNFIDYLNFFQRKYRDENDTKSDYHFKAELIAKENFLELLNGLKRVSVADIYYDKKILGGKYLNLSERSLGVKNEIVLSVRSKWGESIKSTAIDIFNGFNTGDNISKSQAIQKIVVTGKNDLNGDVFLDTDFIEKRETINIEFDPSTGEINTTQAFKQLRAIVQLNL